MGNIFGTPEHEHKKISNTFDYDKFFAVINKESMNAPIESLLEPFSDIPRQRRDIEPKLELEKIMVGGLLHAFAINNSMQTGGDEDSDLEELEEQQNGGNATDLTSNAHMSEVMKMTNLSATSMNNLEGGCGCQPQKGGILSATSVSSQKNNCNNCSISVASQNGGCCGMPQTGGCGCDKQPQNGGDNSDEVNVMPFSSSSNMSNYYANMQRENRYT